MAKTKEPAAEKPAGEKGAAYQGALAVELTAKGTKYYKDDDLNG